MSGIIDFLGSPRVFILSLLTLAFLTGCQSNPPQPAQATPQLEPAITKPYRTFAVSLLPTEGAPNDPSAPRRLAKPAEDAVVSTMSSKGYKLADASAADMIVTLRGEYTPDVLVEGYAKRFLTIEILDSQTRHAIWREERSRSSSETWPPEILQRVIAQMLKTFPEAPALNRN